MNQSGPIIGGKEEQRKKWRCVDEQFLYSQGGQTYYCTWISFITYHSLAPLIWNLGEFTRDGMWNSEIYFRNSFTNQPRNLDDPNEKVKKRTTKIDANCERHKDCHL
jgi:hypothetical protein